jgi:hypothetical protein
MYAMIDEYYTVFPKEDPHPRLVLHARGEHMDWQLMAMLIGMFVGPIVLGLVLR